MLLFREKVPPNWLPKILSDLPAVLVDHAHLERKAATTALNLEKYRDLYPRVEELNAIAIESGERIYQHDLILLGLGDDGHTASLFPGTAALEEMTRRVVANFVPKLNAWRLTFTFPLINHARHVCFLVNAGKNAELIERVIRGDLQFPASRVNPTTGSLTWIIGQ